MIQRSQLSHGVIILALNLVAISTGSCYQDGVNVNCSLVPEVLGSNRSHWPGENLIGCMNCYMSCVWQIFTEHRLLWSPRSGSSVGCCERASLRRSHTDNKQETEKRCADEETTSSGLVSEGLSEEWHFIWNLIDERGTHKGKRCCVESIAVSRALERIRY